MTYYVLSGTLSLYTTCATTYLSFSDKLITLPSLCMCVCVCVSVCLDVSQGGRNHNCYTDRPVILHAQTY